MPLDDIEASLRQNLPAEMHSVIPALAQLLVELDSAPATVVAAQSRLAADPRLSAALRRLASQRVEIGGKVISFDGAQTGDVSIGDVAGGNVVKLNLSQTTINTSGGDYAEGDIDKREGAFISGGSVQGPVIGVNQGTVNYASYSSSEDRLARRNRAALLELVRRFWIEGVLHHSLHEQVYIELGMQTRPDVVDHPWQTLIRLPDSEPRPLDPSQPLLQVFKNAGERLLILGAPGSGKTTTLLVLAEALINEAVANEDRPIPVIFPLSTWAVKQPPLDQWLVEELAQRYKVPLKVGKGWVERGEILPLLDGLDEVGPTDAERALCVGAVNAYLAGQGGQAVVCSRIAEYERQGAQFQLETAVEIQPLTLPQIDCYLERLGSSLVGLRVAVAQDNVLSDLATSPLLLSVMALTYCDEPAEVLMGQAREEADQRLWAGYVHQRLQLRRADAPTAPEQLRAWLIWLSRGMIAHRQQVFYIEYLQPSWLASRGQRRVFHWLSILVGFLVGILVVYLVFGRLVFDLVFDLVLGLGALIFGMVFGLGGIKLTETLSWDWRRLADRRRLWNEIRTSLVVVLGGVLVVLVVVLVVILVVGLDDVGASLGGILVIGLVVGLAFGMFNTVFQQDELQVSLEPNEGIRRSRTNMMIGGLIFSLIFSLILGMNIGLNVGLVFGLVYGVYHYGGKAVLKHSILRLLLHYRCNAPWNFAAFLDEAVSRGFMTRVGGGYRFYHRLLQEHFANHEETTLPVAPILGPQKGDKTGGRRSE